MFCHAQILEKDFQFWSETNIYFPILKKKNRNGEKVEKINFFVSGTFRVGKNLTKPDDERIGGGFDFILNKLVTLTTSYLYRAGQPVTGGKEFEHRIRIEATFGHKWQKFSLKDRNRFEYRFRTPQSDSVRFRNKFTFAVPVKKSGKEIFAPFAATEVFYDFHENKINRNELSLGISKKFDKVTTIDFFYLWQRNRGNVLKNVNVVGVNLKFKID